MASRQPSKGRVRSTQLLQPILKLLQFMFDPIWEFVDEKKRGRLAGLTLYLKYIIIQLQVR